MSVIYLDNNATTRVDPRVLDAMWPWFSERYGNASSRTHAYGWEAEEAVADARKTIADSIGASPKEIVFTSGATESNNLAIKGVMHRNRHRGQHIVTVATEHKAVLDAVHALEKDGFESTILPVDSNGLVDLERLDKAITDTTVLVTVMHANNEIGVIQPISKIASICQAKGALLHTDAAQSLGKIPVNVSELGVDLLSISGHKVYGPKGIGALYIRRAKIGDSRPAIQLRAQIDGGGHERGYRSGTLPVPLCVGLATAISLGTTELEKESARLERLRERLWTGLSNQLDHLHLNGHPKQRLPGNLNLSVGYVEGEALLMAMSDVAVSSGSACTSDSLEPSYVLRAIGRTERLSHSAVRFGIGRFNTQDEIDITIERMVAAVERLRSMSPLWQMVQRGEDPDTVDWTAA
jgi:cysteine desulfurase